MTDFADMESKLRKTRRDLVDALEEIAQLESEIKTLQNELAQYKRSYYVAKEA